MAIDRLIVQRTLVTLMVAFAGGYLVDLTGMPAGWLAGAMTGACLAALAGVRLSVPDGLRAVAFVSLGLSMGAGVTPETIERIHAWPITIAAVILSLPLPIGVSYLILRRLGSFDRATALFASLPGALSYVLAVAPSTGADVPKVAVIQTIRIVFLVLVIPLLGASATREIVMPVMEPVDAKGALLLIALGSIGGYLALKARVPAGLLIGSMLVSSVLHGLDLVHGRMPAFVAVPGFVVLGAMIATRFSGVSLLSVLKVAALSLVVFTAMGLATLAVALSLAAVLDLSGMKVILAFAPGGLEAMVIMAFALDMDPAFVATHHLVRFLAIAFSVPMLARIVRNRP